MSKQPQGKELQTTTTAQVVQSAFSAKALTKDQMNILRTQIAPDISDNDLMYCLEVADNCQLNPILKDIYFVPRQAQINGRWVTKHEPMVGRKGARAIARRKGMKVPPNTGHTIKKFPKFKNGDWVEERDLVGWAELVIDGQIVRKEAAFSVFKQTKKDGSVTKFWQDMPTVMVEKVAEFQLLDAVYGLDGVMSIDAGVLSDDEPITTNVNTANKEDILSALEQLGLKTEFVDDLLIVKGAQMKHSKTLKQLGFGFYNSQWQIRVATDVELNEKFVDAQVEPTPQPQIPQKQKSPAHRLTTYLKENGLTTQEIGEFVKNGLGLSSEDIEGIEAVLSDEESLDVKIQMYLSQKDDGDEVPDSLF